jgi:aspartate/methionine/tyrosine aminotransferase
MNPLAVELNDAIRKENRHVYEMLSSLGKEMYYPKGILTQSAEAKAKAKKFNATLGVATEGGHMMFLPSLLEQLGPKISPDEALNYAPPAGLAELREAWKAKELHDNPSLADPARPMSLPIVTSGLTHGLSIAADLFCEPGDTLLLPDQVWGNYRLTFSVRRGANVLTYPFYGESGGFNVEGLRAALLEAHKIKRKAILILNFPNNPTGYSLTKEEADGVARAIREKATAGLSIVAIVDDAYFGLFYEPELLRESLFTLLAGGPERLLAIKCDAATKEVFVWGLRVGFLSFSAGLHDAVGNKQAPAPAESPLYAALEKKVCGEIRGVLSNCSMLSQRATLNALLSPTFYAERGERQETLRARAEEVQRVLADKRFDHAWEPHRFNSGYFMCLKLKRVTAESLRRHLLDHYGVGTIATAERDLRIAFSCVEKEQIAELFDTIFKAAEEVRVANEGG